MRTGGGRGGGDAEATWTARTSGTSNHLFGIGYSKGTFVAVGNWGTILTSS
jgi:hypothetical protein